MLVAGLVPRAQQPTLRKLHPNRKAVNSMRRGESLSAPTQNNCTSLGVGVVQIFPFSVLKDRNAYTRPI